MKITLLRHEIAENPEEFEGPSDAMRPLTSKGKKRADKIAQNFNHVCEPVDYIASSPFLRAQQTAAPYLDLFTSAHCTEVHWLQPEMDVKIVVKNLKEEKFEHALLVSHDPLISRLASYLLTATESSFIPFKKGALCSIEFLRDLEPGQGELVAFLPPKIMKKVK
ncbi:MAG: phosphohistidine phosphatase SixA [Bdellovibrionales bacterium]|nr:phosphohistidine phosphatase SixA [Bdellovibrionales bacterium]